MVDVVPQVNYSEADGPMSIYAHVPSGMQENAAARVKVHLSGCIDTTRSMSRSCDGWTGPMGHINVVYLPKLWLNINYEKHRHGIITNIMLAVQKVSRLQLKLQLDPERLKLSWHPFCRSSELWRSMFECRPIFWLEILGVLPCSLTWHFWDLQLLPGWYDDQHHGRRCRNSRAKTY